MSLYSSVKDSLAGIGVTKNFLGSVESGIKSGANSLGSFASSALGGGKLASAATKAASTMGAGIISSKINSYIPPQVRGLINSGAQAGGQLLQGDWEGAVLTGLSSSAGSKLLGNVLGRTMSQGRFMGSANRAFADISPTEAIAIHDEIISIRRSKKNLYMISATSEVGGDFSETFNLFCADAEVSLVNIAGDKKRVGGASVDCPSSSEAVELRFTTLDDQYGTIKRWFEEHASAVASRDGTFGVPASYAITFKVLHAYITEGGGFQSAGLYRPVSCEVGLSRREDGFEELQMSFTQLDTFMRP